MSMEGITHRALKRRIRDVLQGADFQQAMVLLEDMPARRAVNPLFSFFCSSDPLLRSGDHAAAYVDFER